MKCAIRIADGITSVGNRREEAIKIEKRNAVTKLLSSKPPLSIQIISAAKPAQRISLNAWNGRIHQGNWSPE